ncbi:hypothetical protein PCANC_25737 [Puccinia coronata f. sp. avenae]|uniref:HAT C-terminal dimerisation domain-containing protein n=1 Tax=Puccinia coronata f. sp. avenae TaxID=200324 RepID=A0A2N5S1J5_9BASI|nr:hypothetical protein PCANC_25737 [Puccinia coronata f. sp. avenae]
MVEEFPLLSSIARDVLACAGSSATVKQKFSAAADVCSSKRKSLAVLTIERCTVIDEAEGKAKFSTQVANLSAKIKSNKIKHVGTIEK